MTVEQHRPLIESAFDQRAELRPDNVPAGIADAIDGVLQALGDGEVRIAEPTPAGWQVNEWLKKAVLLYFRTHRDEVCASAGGYGWDRVPLKFANAASDDFMRIGARVVPPAVVRHGAFIDRNVVLMPSYVNIGAWVGAGTMIDTWATVGSCAQIGRNVHLSGGAGIGGVLEPLQAAPTIIEDDCFIGARSEVVEGVIVERGAVISMGVFIGQSTRIYDRATGEITYGRVPAGAVVVPGSLPAPDGSHALACAVIVKRVDEKTRARTSLNDLLRPD